MKNSTVRLLASINPNIQDVIVSDIMYPSCSLTFTTHPQRCATWMWNHTPWQGYVTWEDVFGWTIQYSVLVCWLIVDVCCWFLVKTCNQLHHLLSRPIRVRWNPRTTVLQHGANLLFLFGLLLQSFKPERWMLIAQTTRMFFLYCCLKIITRPSYPIL